MNAYPIFRKQKTHFFRGRIGGTNFTENPSMAADLRHFQMSRMISLGFPAVQYK